MSKNFNFLIIEDDPGHLEILKHKLAESNFKCTVHAFPSGLDALEFLNHGITNPDQTPFRFPDIIILDLDLPDIDGQDVLKEIKQDKTLQQIPVIIYTSSEEKSDIVEAYRSGSTFFMNKEWDHEILCDAINQIRVIQISDSNNK